METLQAKKTDSPDVQAGSNLPVNIEQGKPGEPAKDKVGPELSAGAFSTFFTYRGYGIVRLNCAHPSIHAGSRVVASISEYNTDPQQNRFVGDAYMQMYNVAPYNGGVAFRFNIGWNSPLNVRIDVIVEP